MSEIEDAESPQKRKVLNVGGNNKKIKLPPQYEQWTHVLLDIDPAGKPDIVCDARKLTQMKDAESHYDAVYCSHNLEHYYHHDVIKVLKGFFFVLNNNGFVHLRVPDLLALIQQVAEKQLDIEDVLYKAPIGDIRVRDVIYGYAPQIARSGNDFYAHKTGFSPKSLVNLLRACGFKAIYSSTKNLEIKVLAFKQKPSETLLKSFSLQR